MVDGVAGEDFVGQREAFGVPIRAMTSCRQLKKRHDKARHVCAFDCGQMPVQLLQLKKQGSATKRVRIARAWPAPFGAGGGNLIAYVYTDFECFVSGVAVLDAGSWVSGSFFPSFPFAAFLSAFAALAAAFFAAFSFWRVALCCS